MSLGDIFKIGQFKSEIARLTTENTDLKKTVTEMTVKMDSFGITDYYKIKHMISELNSEYDKKKATLEEELQHSISSLNQHCVDLEEKEKQLLDRVAFQDSELNKLIKQTKTQSNKLSRSKELVKAVDYALDQYFNYTPNQYEFKISPEQLAELEEISPSIILKLHCMDMKDLRKAYKDNDKQINSILEKYAARYTTKANQAIYKLMVIALRAELQNILYNLKYEKLDKSVDDVKSITQKFLKIAGEGNQSIAGTLTKFIGEIEYLFINAVKIEYNYYVKKEQARQEQLAIKEQMRQEAEERKALEAEKKKVEQEESKYNAQIEKLKEQLAAAKESELEKLNARILELQSQLADVVVKKEEITNLANGKAGNVYIISNLGSFGEDVFKIGMTRRLNPQDRVNELGDASVPFRFDVHSFIFSDDAVGLESKLHTILNDKRVNKVNLRKEFFRTTIDELEALVTEIEPTAEFNKTMLAEEFRQSISTDEIYTNEYVIEDNSFDEE